MPQTAILTTLGMLDEHIQPDTFTPSLHIFPDDVRKSLNHVLETLKSQFAQDETSFRTAHLTKMQIQMADSEPVLPRPYPIAVKHYDWVRSWSGHIIVVPKGDGGKHLMINYRVLNKVTGSLPRVKVIFQS